MVKRGAPIENNRKRRGPNRKPKGGHRKTEGNTIETKAEPNRRTKGTQKNKPKRGNRKQ